MAEQAVYTNAAEVSAAFRQTGRGAKRKVKEKVRHFSMLMETRVKANASGRPGPNVITGDYRRSWSNEVSENGNRIVGTIGTNKPQARRLEYGFAGADRLGRVYNQPPFPHLGPAVDTIGPEFMSSMGDTIQFGD